MSFIQRMFTCPCKTRACRIMRARRLLLVLIAGALLALQALIMTGTVHDPIGAGKPSTPSVAMLMPATQAAAQIEATGITTTAAIAASPAQEWHACHLAIQVHEHQLQGVTVSPAAWWQAWRAASDADPGLRADIHHSLKTGRGWTAVWSACNPDGWS